MRDEHSQLEAACTRLRAAGARSISMWLDSDMSTYAYVEPVPVEPDQAAAEDVREAATVVKTALHDAAWALCNLQLQDLSQFDDGAGFDLTADLENDVFEYRAYGQTGEDAQLQQRARTWQLADGQLFFELDFRSELFGSDQAEVLEAWRPHAAESLELSWTFGKDGTVTANSREMHFSAIWPERTPSEVNHLRKKLDLVIAPLVLSHPRGKLTRRLVMDFRAKSIELTEWECVDVEHDFCSGVMPLSELSWIAQAKPAAGALTDEEKTEWLSTGRLAAPPMSDEELFAQVCVEAPLPQPGRAAVMGEDTAFDDEDGGTLSSAGRDEEAEERALRTAELLETEDSMERSREGGWFYKD